LGDTSLANCGLFLVASRPLIRGPGAAALYAPLFEVRTLMIGESDIADPHRHGTLRDLKLRRDLLDRPSVRPKGAGSPPLVDLGLHQPRSQASA
jgi:hypothetical protein